MVEAFEDKYEAWDWIIKNLGQVMIVGQDGTGGYCAFIKACNYLKNVKLISLIWIFSNAEGFEKMVP